MRLDPVLSFRILRYLNSPALALTHRIESLDQALIILGRQRLTRWLAVLLFSVREPQLNDWLLVENALTRGRLMEVLGAQLLPGQPHDPLFLTGIFSCLDRLLRRPLAEVLGTMPIADEIRLALLERQGPYAALLAVAEASESVDQAGMAGLARAAGVDPDRLNRALLAATAWASEVTERLYTGSGSLQSLASVSNSTRTLSETSTALEYLRPISVRFDLKGWGPGEPLGAITFDGIPVAGQPLPGGVLEGSQAGELSGTFTIPENVTAGTKTVLFTGTLGSKGSQTFMGQGTAVLRSQQAVRTETWSLYDPAPVYAPASTGGAVFGPAGSGSAPARNSSQCSRWLYEGYFDPLAQTFVLDVATQAAGIDLWFTAKGGPVVVQIRETSNGVPTSTVVVEQRVPMDAIQLGQFTRVTWVPAMLQAKREYAVVVLCDDATTALAVAELGKQDPTQGYVTSQPYQVGVLLSSSNASTWTAHQDRDLTFRLLAAQYTETERVIDLGTADLVDATDLMILGFAERPSAAANLTFDLEFPPALDSEVVRLTDGQVVWLAEPFTGQVKVRARITGDATAAAILGPGVQLIAAKIEPSATYITRTVAASGNNRVLVVYEGDIPGGSSVQVHAQANAAGAPWVPVPYLSASTNTAGVREITHELTGFAAATGLRVRLTLTGSTTARPYVGNLRVVVL